jgi:predicted nucleic acid-binding protein
VKRGFGSSIRLPRGKRSVRRLTKMKSRPNGLRREGGHANSYTCVADLVDTNILVYRYDARFPAKQAIATQLLRNGIVDDSVRLPHQAIIEFVAATTRPVRGAGSILEPEEARREAEELLSQFGILYPTEDVVRTAIRGAAAYKLSWFDAHLWAYAEVYGLEILLSEDFQHDRLYGKVRIINPFI